MGITVTITSVPALTSVTSDYVCLYHGTDIESAIWIKEYGLDEGRASASGGEGQFWCVPMIDPAATFAISTLSNKPTIVALEIPVSVIATCLTTAPPLVLLHPMPSTVYYQFRPSSFQILNESMTNVKLIDVRTTFPKKRN